MKCQIISVPPGDRIRVRRVNGGSRSRSLNSGQGIKKSRKPCKNKAFGMVPVAGVEPARVISPTDFESVTSANSITPA